MGIFFAAALFSLSGEDRIAGILGIACGVFVVAFNRSMSDAAKYFSSKSFGPPLLKEGRPFTFVLFGVGIVILGVISLVSV
jgi:hypothetical protein